MIKVSWDVEELVALIDIYRRSKGKSYEQIDAELMSLSDTLNKRADRLGIVHDEKYRNLNGMKLMFQNVVFIATDGKEGMSSTSIPMQKVYNMLSTSPDVFDLILHEFIHRYSVSQ